MALLPPAQQHILAQENGKDRFIAAFRELHQAFALAVPHEETKKIRDDLAFFQDIQSALLKPSPSEVRADEALDHAMRQIISRAVAPEGVIDVFEAAGLESRTCPYCPTSSWMKCAVCLTATWRSSFSRSC